ncbi:hypothetical protein OV450_2514 [Actinobacteria bacterium OV450]|nr:hypothetical protein OV450_2514 [Actinobacteria bacterium OV450]
MTNQLDNVPHSLTAQELAALNEALAAHYTYQAAASYLLEIPLSATRIVDSVRPPNVPPGDTGWVLLRNDLKEKAEEYMQQYACEQSWSVLTSKKKEEVPAPATNSVEALKQYVDAVAQNWKSTAVGQYLAWNNYVTGVAEKMQQLVSQGHLTEPGQAYVYYDRYCMAPP